MIGGIKLKYKRNKVKRLIILGIALVVFLILNNSIAIPSALKDNEKSNSLDKIDVNEPSDVQTSQLPDNAGGYISRNAANFSIIENASSLMDERDYLADESNTFNLTTPQQWNISSMSFNFNPYSKEQIIEDPYFEYDYDNIGKYWDIEQLESGEGYFTQYDLNYYQYARTHIYNSRDRTIPAFFSGDYAFWTHQFSNLNPANLDIQKGKIIQEQDKQTVNFDYFSTDPGFYKDLDSPYGGTYRPLYDDVDLIYDESVTSLKVTINPGKSSLGGNPSAAWWYFINIPYEADYAQVTLKWNIEDVSTFEAPDQYEVIARINNKYIDGSSPIAKDVEIPFNGSSEALMVYNNPKVLGYIHHDTISRTYDITSLINGLVGINKFDFGVWAKNPTQQGDQDLIVANFESIEFLFNTTTKYEVANLKYRYKLIDDDSSGTNMFKFSNDASFFLYLRDIDTDESELIRVLPFSMAEVSSHSYSLTPWIDMEFSISQKYQDIIEANNLEFKIGIYFENNFYQKIDYYHYLDNLFMTINYNQTVTQPQLRIKVDNAPTWDNVTISSYNINTSAWISGESHTFQFNTLDGIFQDNLYLNFESDLKVSFKSTPPDAGKAVYSIYGGNSSIGEWNITYDNSFSYSKLLDANLTGDFELINYSIAYLDMPAFDNEGSNSVNWDIYGAVAPNFDDFSENIIRFNYSAYTNNQSAKIFQAFMLGNWTLKGTQLNYIESCMFNTTKSYLNLPAFYKDEIVQFNYSILEPIAGSYSFALYNETGDLLQNFSQYFTSTGLNIIGTIDLANNYKAGKYYLYIKWNDTTTYDTETLRFGSIIQSFYIINNTKASFTKVVAQVSSGAIAEFGLNYTTYENWGIENAVISVFENSTGILRWWGRAWTGVYQVGNITYLGNGNYSIPLFTEGAPNGTYPIYFVCYKALHEVQILHINLIIIAENYFEFNISFGAHLEITDWVIDSNNIPYVNDSINSIIRVNLTDSGLPVVGGLVIGRIGESENYFEANEIGGGIYDLTLDTNGLNATLKEGSIYVENETLEIRCSASGYDPQIIDVTIFIDKIPTQITLQDVQDVFAEGSFNVLATMVNEIDPINPKPNNNANLTYYIYQGGNLKRSGPLDFLVSGVYQKNVQLSGLIAGEYSLFINGSAFNCEDSQSNIVYFTIIPQKLTVLEISVPSTIRILKEFQIRTTLSYYTNSTTIPDQTVFLNISVGQSESFIVSTITDNEGISHYYYIISSQYLNQNITIEAYYGGQEKLSSSYTSISQIIYGKIPLSMVIFDFPSFLRVGYSARYGLKINITDLSETLQNRIILFSAYYNDEFSTPFVTDQLYTDESGQCEFIIDEIGDGKDNLTVFFEYLGSTTISYNLTSRVDLISPKWSTSFTIDPLPTTLRFGQLIHFNAQFYCENTSISLSNLPVSITFKYGTTIESYTELIDSSNILSYFYRIADFFNGNLNISIIFSGTSKLEGTSLNYSLIVNPKIGVVIEFLETPQTQYLYGTYSFKVSIKTSLGDPLDGLLIVFQLLNTGGNEISNYTAICENGIATGSLNLEVGDSYQIRIQFYSEDYYESASITSQNIRVLNEFMIFLDLLPYILLVIGIVLAISFVIYRGFVVPKRRRRIKSLKELYQKLSDVENMQYLLVITKDGGVPCFSKSLADVPIDESLVSGFLSAISSFGLEIGSKIQEGEGGLEELSYRQFKIIINEGSLVKVALLLLKRPSETLKQKLKSFVKYFEDVYKDDLIDFSGEVFQDVPVTKMIEDIFEADLLYPHQVVENKVKEYLKTSSPNNIDKKIIIIARGEDFESNFYLRDLINHLKTKGIEEIKSFESIQKLKSKNVVFAINPRTNYLIEEFRKYIKFMDADDKNVLFAIFDGSNDIMQIRKYLNKRNIALVADVENIIEKIRKLKLINEENQITDTGSAVATILKLIPDL